MNFFKRAWLNVWAKKGRSVLLILVSSAILMFVLAGLLIRSAAVKATETAKTNAGATVTLSANRQAAFKKMQSQSSSSTKASRPKLTLTPVKLSDAKNIAKLSNIKSYNVTSSTTVNAKSYDTVSTSTGMGAGGGPGGMKGSSQSSGDTQIDGVTATALTTAFTDNQSKVTKGRGITASDEGTNNVVIEKELASQNNITVGDTLTFKQTTGSKKTIKAKIVGIYKASSSSTSTGPMSVDPANTIYASYTLANTLKGSKYAGTADSVTFNVKNPAKVSATKRAGKQLISSKYSLSTDDAAYQSVKSSMNNVESFANKIVWLVAIAGTIILALIVILMIRERRFEIGVLLSLGEARWKIVAQFFTEMLMVIVIALAVAGVGGKFVGNQLGSQLVAQSTTTQTTSRSSNQPGGGQPGGSNGGNQHGAGGPDSTATTAAATKKANLEISMSAVDLAELGGFGLAITFLSIMIASGGILRLEPKKVLIS
ncbi:ABC transporter permease [Levilactobacillus tujiorum]|uniref:ABC transporter permease n=1 Tax=Levilactobacillus tujiorum TaxID=2912243 RepID=UPI0014573C6F|nr:ABC transporter permease [Levilactobacillus tujiorum]NLR31955.1 ABC transporter permease [Levilactobacillus tujiorum]